MHYSWTGDGDGGVERNPGRREALLFVARLIREDTGDRHTSGRVRWRRQIRFEPDRSLVHAQRSFREGESFLDRRRIANGRECAGGRRQLQVRGDQEFLGRRMAVDVPARSDRQLDDQRGTGSGADGARRDQASADVRVLGGRETGRTAASAARPATIHGAQNVETRRRNVGKTSRRGESPKRAPYSECRVSVLEIERPCALRAICVIQGQLSAGRAVFSRRIESPRLHDTRGRHPPRSLRDPRAARRGRDGGGLPRARQEARPGRRRQGPAAGVAADPDTLARFEREAKAVAALSHPNILSIFDFGDQDGIAYAVMELLEGETLRGKLDAGPITAEAGGRLHAPDREGPLRGAREGHRPPGPEAREPLRLERRTPQDPRLRTREARRVRRAGRGDERADGLGTHGARHGDGDGGLHVARAGEGALRSTTARTSSRSARSSTSCSRARRRSGGRRTSRRWRPSCGTSRPSCRSRGGTSLRRWTASSGTAWRRTATIGSSRRGTSRSTSRSSPRRRRRAAPRRSRRRRAPPGFRIAVLPFKCGTADADVLALADGLSEEIVSGLSRFRYLSVVDERLDASLDRRRRRAAPAGGSGARYVVEGSIRRGGSDLRVGAQLVDARTGARLWSETYRRDLQASSLFAVQDDVAGRIVATVADSYGVLVHSIRAASRQKDDADLTPVEWQFQYFAYREQITPSSYASLKSRLERAAERNDRQSDVWACLAQVYVDEYAFGFGERRDVAGSGPGRGPSRGRARSREPVRARRAGAGALLPAGPRGVRSGGRARDGAQPAQHRRRRDPGAADRAHGRVRARRRDRAPRDGAQSQPRGLDALRSALGALPQGRVRAGPGAREPGGRARPLLALPRGGVGQRSSRPARRGRVRGSGPAGARSRLRGARALERRDLALRERPHGTHSRGSAQGGTRDPRGRRIGAGAGNRDVLGTDRVGRGSRRRGLLGRGAALQVRRRRRDHSRPWPKG